MSIYRKTKNVIIKPIYYYFKDIFLKQNKLLKRNSQLADKHQGERCFLILTGESLSQIDMKKLSHEYTLSSGNTFLHKEINDLYLKYYFAGENRKYLGKFNWPDAMPPTPNFGLQRSFVFHRMVEEKLYNSGTKCFVRLEDFEYFTTNRIYQSDTSNLYYMTVLNNLLYKNVEKHIINPTRRLSIFSGSIFVLILLAIYMGFKEMYLCGAGYTYNPVYQLHFYDNYTFPKSLSRSEAEGKAASVVTQHNKKFSSNIRLYGLHETQECYRGIYVNDCEPDSVEYQSHIKMKKIAEKYNVRIFNVVPDGFESPIYEKVSWEKVLSTLK